MNAQNYTQKSLEAIQAAQKLTIENRTFEAGERPCAAAAEKDGYHARKL